MSRPVRIANCSGFFGDRFSALSEQLDGGDIDYLTGDYLAELTMSILWKARQSDPGAGYATTFVKQLEGVLGRVLDQGVRVVVNAGGLNPAGLAERLRELNKKLGMGARVMHLEGDDLSTKLAELQSGGHNLAHLDTGVPLGAAVSDVATANAYLGSWGIVEALAQGADIVVCPRVTDAALTVGPAAFHHGWRRDDWDRLAGAVVAGHLVECGCQVTGGNYPFFSEIPGLEHPGFPIVEVEEDGAIVLTKHPGTGGAVTVGTATAQLVYEIDSPRYLTPDVVARFDTVALSQEGPDRVRVDGTRGEPPPQDLKVSMTLDGGFRNTFTFMLAGLQIPEKAHLVERALWARLGGRERFEHSDVTLIRSDREDPASNEQALASLRITVMGRDAALVGRDFSAAAVGLGLANYPGYFLATPPGRGSSYTVNWPTLVPVEVVDQVVVDADGVRTSVDGRRTVTPASPVLTPAVAPVLPPEGPTVRAPLGLVGGARSGDKGGNANVGVWSRDEVGYAWLRDFLTVDRLQEILPETASLVVDRYELPRIRALNFVVHGLLGLGVSSNPLLDPQAKSLGEYVRAKVVEVPVALLTGNADSAGSRIR